MSDKRTIEARTIRDLAELRAFLDQVDAVTDRSDDTIHLGTPIDIRLIEITLTDGSTVFDLETSSWKG